jgi:hypothetical protein
VSEQRGLGVLPPEAPLDAVPPAASAELKQADEAIRREIDHLNRWATGNLHRAQRDKLLYYAFRAVAAFCSLLSVALIGAKYELAAVVLNVAASFSIALDALLNRAPLHNVRLRAAYDLRELADHVRRDWGALRLSLPPPSPQKINARLHELLEDIRTGRNSVQRALKDIETRLTGQPESPPPPVGSRRSVSATEGGSQAGRTGSSGAHKLTGEEQCELVDALLDAFPSIDDMKQFVRFRLDKSLEALAGNGSLRTIVFRLTEETESDGATNELISAAIKARPRNPKLRAFAERWSESSLATFGNSANPDKKRGDSSVALLLKGEHDDGKR